MLILPGVTIGVHPRLPTLDTQASATLQMKRVPGGKLKTTKTHGNTDILDNQYNAAYTV